MNQPKLFARIRKTSKYAGQDNGQLFPVHLSSDWEMAEGFIWRGGPGGRYRHSDLQLFVLRDDKPVPVPMLSAGEGEANAYLEIILQFWEDNARDGYFHPDYFGPQVEQLIERLQEIKQTAIANFVEEED